MKTTNAIVLLTWLLMLAGCAKTAAPNSGGSESHFLSECEVSSECGSELSCIANVCTIECESDAPCIALDADATCELVAGATQACVEQLSDASTVAPPEPDASTGSGSDSGVVLSAGGVVYAEPELLGTSDALAERVEMAFIESRFGDEQVWLRGESGALRMISAWPADDGWVAEAPCANYTMIETDIHVAGMGRFSSLTLDATNEYLVFIESLGCHTESKRVVVHQLATGQSWAVGTFSLEVELAAGTSSMLASARNDDNEYDLYEIELDEPKLISMPVFSGNQVAGAALHIVGLDANEELVVVHGHPVLHLSDEGVHVFEPIEALGPDLQISEMRMSPSGGTLCMVTLHALEGTDDPPRAVMIRADEATIEPLSEFAFGCVYTGSGRYVMFGNNVYEVVADELVAVPGPSEPMFLSGASGELFYGLNQEQEIVRFDPATGQTDVIIGLDVLDASCGENLREPLGSNLYLAKNEGSVGIAQHYCGDFGASDQSSMFAIDLATGAYELIETGGAARNVFEAVWRSDGSALLFSAAMGTHEPSFYEIGAGPEITVHALEGLDDFLHTAALAH